uniref:Uncharacterized protein n=1 Tax=Leersia perrieri TaxID=77586 RepID=A0A0D9VRS0_9ORYZ
MVLALESQQYGQLSKPEGAYEDISHAAKSIAVNWTRRRPHFDGKKKAFPITPLSTPRAYGVCDKGADLPALLQLCRDDRSHVLVPRDVYASSPLRSRFPFLQSLLVSSGIRIHIVLSNRLSASTCAAVVGYWARRPGQSAAALPAIVLHGHGNAAGTENLSVPGHHIESTVAFNGSLPVIKSPFHHSFPQLLPSLD